MIRKTMTGKIKWMLSAGVLLLLLTGCRFVEESKALNDGKVEKREQDDAFAYDDFEYYTYYSGSSSVNERAVIYEYDGKLIFAAQYFDCGDMLMETEKLTAGLEERFWKEIENCERQDYDEDEEETEGGFGTESYLAMKDGTLYKAEALDWEQIGIDFKDASDVNYPRETGFDIEGLEEVMEAEQREKLPTWVSQEFLAVVEEQLLEQLDEDIVSAYVEKIREDDFLLTVETESGANYQAVVTYMGYVDSVTEGNAF